LGLPKCLLPQTILYRELRKEWQEGTIRISSNDYGGMSRIEFCYCNVETCPWGMDFCSCKDEEWYTSGGFPF
jgi:hypothetical protein